MYHKIGVGGLLLSGGLYGLSVGSVALRALCGFLGMFCGPSGGQYGLLGG